MYLALAQDKPLWRALLSSKVGLVFVVTFFCASLSHSSAWAVAPCHVPSSAYPAVQTAVNDPICATIQVAAGIYYELVTINRSVTIRGEGQENTVVDGAGRGPVFTIDSGTVTLANVTIRNGVRKALVGGGIYNAGRLTVQNSTLSDNSAIEDQGGGIYNVFATLIVQNSTFYNNSAFAGGGIFNVGGAVTVQNSIFSGNNTKSTFPNFSHGGVGGGIVNIGMLTVQNSIFADNSAGTLGGGIYSAGTKLTVQNSIFADNSAGTLGGGIYIETFIGDPVTLTHVTFQNNTPNDCTRCP
jgi:predicted outer membrane repeat protein